MTINNLEIYRAWAPEDSPWAAWAKPVLFASMTSFGNTQTLFKPGKPKLPLDAHTAVIVDLPGAKGVKEALGLAVIGYQPVPLYNGVSGPGKMVVDARPLSRALFIGADLLRQQASRTDAPPVFMLDSDRMKESASGTFDNRWCVFPQDMPSAQYLKSKGIEKIILYSENLATDLSRVLYDYQKDGLNLFILDEKSLILRGMQVKKRSIVEEWAYRLRVVMGLARNATGGFGSQIPSPYERSNSGTYYRMG